MEKENGKCGNMDTASVGRGENFTWLFVLTRTKSSSLNSQTIRRPITRFTLNFLKAHQKQSSGRMLMEPMTERDVTKPTLAMGHCQ